VAGAWRSIAAHCSFVANSRFQDSIRGGNLQVGSKHVNRFTYGLDLYLILPFGLMYMFSGELLWLVGTRMINVMIYIRNIYSAPIDLFEKLTFGLKNKQRNDV
jgi:hypothetical protein